MLGLTRSRHARSIASSIAEVRLVVFWATAARRCHFEFMPVEGRLYFMHKANTNASDDEA
jgi:hypothetical protein